MEKILYSIANWFVELFKSVGMNAWTWIKSQGPKILGSLAILLIGWWLAVSIAKGVRKVLRKSKVDKGVTSFVYSVVKATLLVVVVISAIAQLGVNITSVIAALGAAGITAGLALKDTLSNFASGIFILFNRPFVTGDYIEVDGSAGTVEEIELMFTTLKTPDNKHLVYPNSKLTENKIINHTAEQYRRLDLPFPLPYGVDIEQARRIICEVYDNNAYVIHNDEDRKMETGITDFGSSSVNFEVRAWILASDYWNARFSLNESVKAVLEANGIQIPFTQVDVNIKQ